MMISRTFLKHFFIEIRKGMIKDSFIAKSSLCTIKRAANTSTATFVLSDCLSQPLHIIWTPEKTPVFPSVCSPFSYWRRISLFSFVRFFLCFVFYSPWRPKHKIAVNRGTRKMNAFQYKNLVLSIGAFFYYTLFFFAIVPRKLLCGVIATNNIIQMHQENTGENFLACSQMKDWYLFGGNKPRTININWLNLINKS